MAKITEDYVSFETAKLLKEKKFLEPCRHYYFTNGIFARTYGLKHRNPSNVNTYSAPTLQMVCKWLRIEHNIFIEPRVGENDGRDWYDFDIIPVNGRVIHWTSLPQVPVIECDSPEEAIEDAIKYCLENLI